MLFGSDWESRRSGLRGCTLSRVRVGDTGQRRCFAHSVPPMGHRGLWRADCGRARRGVAESGQSLPRVVVGPCEVGRALALSGCRRRTVWVGGRWRRLPTQRAGRARCGCRHASCPLIAWRGTDGGGGDPAHLSRAAADADGREPSTRSGIHRGLRRRRWRRAFCLPRPCAADAFETNRLGRRQPSPGWLAEAEGPECRDWRC